MDQHNNNYFSILYARRKKSAEALDDFALRGVKNSVVEKYSDQAHFIYELLQNADDARATTARFELHKNQLIFSHNGVRRFTLSNPDTEEIDQKNGTLGDINSITAVGGSNKTNNATIGKFGVGFKAVFQYTATPHIFDPEVFFKIERFIVPNLLEKDYPGRKKDETLFLFPFDHNDRTAANAFEDISRKLRSLDYPILFLTNLEDISFEIPEVEVTGRYRKSVEKKFNFDKTHAEFIRLTQNNAENQNNLYDHHIWLFSRHDENGHTYSVGFSANIEGNLIANPHPAFCFFPTKETTGLNFIIHAPFLLNDSREGILAGVQHNRDMVLFLAKLAADSLIFLKEIGQNDGTMLINDDIFDIIPYDEYKFNDINDKNKISFKPFYTAIKEKLLTEELIPSSDGYASSKNAYWATVPRIAELFSNELIALLSENENAKWVFTTFGREDILRKNKALTNYIDSVISNWLNEEDILKGWLDNGTKNNGISPNFIEMQSIEWLHNFYKWVSETKTRTILVKTKPIFLNQDRKAMPAFDEKDRAVLFLPTEDNSGCDTICSELLKNDDTVSFIKQLGVTTPSLKDVIYNKILPLYNDSADIDTRPHFKKFFQYYNKECPQSEVTSFLSLIKDHKFVLCRLGNDGNRYRSKANNLYFPFESLRTWFKSKPKTYFVEFDEYLQLVGEENKEDLISFLSDLGVQSEPKFLTRNLSIKQAYQIRSDWPCPSKIGSWTENYIDGCEEIIESIIQKRDNDLSQVVWNQLLKFAKYGYLNIQIVMSGKYSYFPRYARSSQIEFFNSTETIRLRTQPWLISNSGEFQSANSLTIQTLSPQYDLSSDGAAELLRLLGIGNNAREDEHDDNLTDEQRAKIESYDRMKAAGITDEEIDEFIRQSQKRMQTAVSQQKNDDDEDNNSGVTDIPDNPSVSRVVKEISKRISSAFKTSTEAPLEQKENAPDNDEDDYSKPSVDFNKKIEQAKQRSEHEIREIARLEDLTRQAQNAGKYSFGWFKALLELESLTGGENNANSREISIVFSKVEREEGTSRTVILRHPNRYIPQSMEDLADIPLELHFDNQPTIKVAIEVVNVKSYTLRAKLRTNAQIDGVDLSLVTEARVEARNPVFLIEELLKAFSKFGDDNSYGGDFDMQGNLCENIEFVFGPPGTGKTTHLAREVIIPIMRKTDDFTVLVLTPTNKAADVLVCRLMENMGNDCSYTEWLVRFGTTNDSTIEQSGVFRDKTFDIRTFPRNVTVTTIARFPYDYFLPDENTRLHLSALKWDYIIIDEASMIPLVNIIFPLYKKTPEKFIISGDPFQIEPITAVDIWKDENIYTMVELKSFSEPVTIPHPYHVELLTTQYRSIPEIGEVFSRFAYGGVLKHNRTTESQRPLQIKGFINVKPLNIIKFPVSKYESIYRPKQLRGKSNYQVYSALFAFEFVKFISEFIGSTKNEKLIRIGLIAPYRAQADLVDKLMASVKIPEGIDVQVGTIHGFQGDECDIIIALFNPPPFISTSKEMFLNKFNIINVSISRAKDYLFIIMPDDNTENIKNLTLIKRVERLCKEQPDWTEQQSPSIEDLILGSNTFIEDNSFSTSHQLVNVYRKPEKRYEVRSEDNAVDVQIHE
jgi:hypothetical protein